MDSAANLSSISSLRENNVSLSGGIALPPSLITDLIDKYATTAVQLAHSNQWRNAHPTSPEDELSLPLWEAKIRSVLFDGPEAVEEWNRFLHRVASTSM